MKELPFDPCAVCKYEPGLVSPDKEGKIMECPFTRLIDGLLQNPIFENHQKGILISRLRESINNDPENSFYYCPELNRYFPYNPEEL